MPLSKRDKKTEILSTIDAVMTILEKLPILDNKKLSLSINANADPLEFLMDMFKRTAGYDKLIEFISRFISVGTPLLEMGIKSILISNMKNLLSCSLDVFIPDSIIKEGVAFDVKNIDLMDILRYSPLYENYSDNQFNKNIGRYFYFDCDDIDIPDDLLNSNDLNSFIWYIMNKGMKREVWGKTEERIHSNDKDLKKNGIITLEYHERGDSMTDIEGNGDIPMQTPIYNCLHVFLGNGEPLNVSDVSNKKNEIKNKNRQIKHINFNIKNYINNINKNKKLIKTNKKSFDKGEIDNSEYSIIETDLRNDIDKYNRLISDSKNEIITLQEEITLLRGQIRNTNFNYQSFDKNYYHNRTLIEFNFDYIMGVKFFDSKTITAQLLDALTNCLSVDLNLSVEQIIVKNELHKIINNIITTDHSDVSDCFFAFTNDEYNSLLSKSEKIRNGLLSINGEENGGVKINAEEILSKLNNINKNSSKEEIMTIINDTLIDLSKELSSVEYSDNYDVNFGVRMNIIENMLNELSYVIISNILSPKIYLLILINLRIMENKQDFNLIGFIHMFEQFIVNIIREVRDYIIKFLVDELMNLIDDIIEKISLKLTIEQSEYYHRLISRLISNYNHAKSYLNENKDFNIDNVDYADIISDDKITPETNIC